MAIPLRDFRRITESIFYTDVEARKDEYFSIVNMYYDRHKEAIENEQSGTLFFDADHSNKLFLSSSKNYTLNCYENLELRELSALKEVIYGYSDNEKARVYVQKVVGELKHILHVVKSLKLAAEFVNYRNGVGDGISKFIEYLSGSYLRKDNDSADAFIIRPKIRFDGDMKILATLFFDLLHGQTKITKRGEPPRTLRPLLKANATDIQRLLVDNFMGAGGESFAPGTLVTYFNRSKDVRSKNKRIELDYDI